MKTIPPSRPRRTNAARRAQLLAAFDRSGLSAADFARRHQLNYTTFCGWRQARDKAQTSPAFVQVELPEPPQPTELVIELGSHARIRIHCANQIQLAAQLLQQLDTSTPC